MLKSKMNLFVFTAYTILSIFFVCISNAEEGVSISNSSSSGSNEISIKTIEDGINVRNKPSLNSPIVMQLNKGIQLKVISRHIANKIKWAQVELDSTKNNWIIEEFLDENKKYAESINPLTNNANMNNYNAVINNTDSPKEIDTLKYADEYDILSQQDATPYDYRIVV
ncbi:secreted protein containing SH3, type 3 domain protein, partial [Candidatus Magnetoovum chiemensis]